MEFQGLLKHEGKAKYGDAYKQWQIDAANFNIDGHYPVRELWERARNSWNKILRHDGQSILVVAHNAVNQALVATAIGKIFPFFFFCLFDKTTRLFAWENMIIFSLWYVEQAWEQSTLGSYYKATVGWLFWISHHHLVAVRLILLLTVWIRYLAKITKIGKSLFLVAKFYGVLIVYFLSS